MTEPFLEVKLLEVKLFTQNSSQMSRGIKNLRGRRQLRQAMFTPKIIWSPFVCLLAYLPRKWQTSKPNWPTGCSSQWFEILLLFFFRIFAWKIFNVTFYTLSYTSNWFLDAKLKKYVSLESVYFKITNFALEINRWHYLCNIVV